MPDLEPSQSAPSLPFREALASVTQQCQNIGVLTLITVSALNALECDPDYSLPDDILRFLPQASCLLNDLMLWHGCDADDLRLAKSVHAQCQDVTAALRACVAKESTGACVIRGDLFVVTRAWRRFAGTLARALKRIAEARPLDLPQEPRLLS